MSLAFRSLIFLGCCALIGAATAQPAAAAELAASATEVRPLLLGSAVPEVKLQTVDGADTTLKTLLAGKPAVLVFYRGGWCPFCNLQLSNLRLIEKDLTAAGYQLIAISPDRPEELRRTLDKQALGYTLVSDHHAEAIKAFGIGFVLDAETTGKYAKFGIDIDQASGEKHHGLPVPSVFIVDGAGTLQFEYVHPDYKVRVPSEVILAAAQAIAADKQTLKRQP
ncbi:MAG: peroxiredoxin-like family protein [Lysobacterales bacterium]|uniref:peroxiredoxin-like family protein n=1 Tax=Hydrogenophaga sp. TaxID=1904254 RepID=UPI003D102D70